MHPLPVFSILPIGLRVDKALGVKPGKNAYCPMSYILLPVMPFHSSFIDIHQRLLNAQQSL